MLLRRVTLHIKQQNWFAVLVDFLIVVLGVFIGVQVANWNDTAKQHQLYQDAFNRVKLEIATNIEAVKRVQAYYRSRLPQVQLALETLRTCGQNGESIKSVEDTFQLVQNYSQVILTARDTELLLGNNNFLPFQNSELRTRLSKLADYTYFFHQELAMKTNQIKDVRFLSRLQAGPVLGSPDDNLQAIKSGSVGSAELIRKHRFGVPFEQACKDKLILEKYYGWEEAVYFHFVVGQFTVEHLTAELAYLEGLPRS
ncbi:MAG TPA: hypothetical protein DCW59_01545 [Alteromonas sp.]|nr:hypothetical protein [Alteromonas sp.]